MRPKVLDRLGCLPVLAFAISLLWATLALAESPVPVIRLPSSVTPVSPIAVTELATEAIFVIECDSPCMVLASREGYVTIEEQPGPLRIRGRFADGAKVETRTYKAKQLWIIEAATSGEVEILIVPEGVKDASKVIRRTLVVGASGPRPPPKPDNPPPKPEPPIVQPPIVNPPTTPVPGETPLGLIPVVKSAVEKHVPANQRMIAAKLAESYRQGAESLARGVWTPANAAKNQQAINHGIPGYQSEAWQPVFTEIANVLGAARDAGKLTTAKQWTAAWAELSVAFFQAHVAAVGQ